MQPPKGTRDFGPDEMARRRRLEDRLRRVLHAFNFREVQTPTFEEFDLFKKKAGDAIGEEIYVFKDKGDRELCLRPELTLPVMRFYFGSELRVEPKPLRLFYFGRCFRYDKPQEGRYREFWQLGTEVVGDATPEAHAELLWLGLSLLKAAGVGDIQLRIGHLAILRGLIQSILGIPIAAQGPLMRLIDKKDAPGLRTALAGVDAAAREKFLGLLDNRDVAAARAMFAVPNASADVGFAHVEAVFRSLGGFGADLTKIRFDPTIARGLEYYSGLVFELDCPALGTQKQILGGGEYDLSQVFDAQAVPTVGFGLGFDRTLVALEKLGTAPSGDERADAIVAALSAAAVPAAQEIANALRDLDLRVELDLGAKGPKRPLQRGTAVKARLAVLLGDRDLERAVATVKDLAAGTQHEVPLKDVVATVSRGAAAAPPGTR